jgi:hypothetical protein
MFTLIPFETDVLNPSLRPFIPGTRAKNQNQEKDHRSDFDRGKTVELREFRFWLMLRLRNTD